MKMLVDSLTSSVCPSLGHESIRRFWSVDDVVFDARMATNAKRKCNYRLGGREGLGYPSVSVGNGLCIRFFTYGIKRATHFQHDTSAYNIIQVEKASQRRIRGLIRPVERGERHEQILGPPALMGA